MARPRKIAPTTVEKIIKDFRKGTKDSTVAEESEVSVSSVRKTRSKLGLRKKTQVAVDVPTAIRKYLLSPEAVGVTHYEVGEKFGYTSLAIMRLRHSMGINVGSYAKYLSAQPLLEDAPDA